VGRAGCRSWRTRGRRALRWRAWPAVASAGATGGLRPQRPRSTGRWPRHVLPPAWRGTAAFACRGWSGLRHAALLRWRRWRSTRVSSLMSSSTTLRYSGGEADEAELRAGVVRLGALLGCDASVVARFAEAVTGRDWICCGRDELLEVLAAYAVIVRRVRSAQARMPGASGACRGGRRAQRRCRSDCGLRACNGIES
jgi:hypothetical protein